MIVQLISQVGILTAYDTSGNDLAAARVALADICDIRDDACSSRVVMVADSQFVLCDIGAEFLRVSKGRILLCDVLPQTPAAARADLCIAIRCMILVAVDSTFCTASVCDEYKVILGENNTLFHTMLPCIQSQMQSSCPSLKVENNIGYFSIESGSQHQQPQGTAASEESETHTDCTLVNFRALKSGRPEI